MKEKEEETKNELEGFGFKTLPREYVTKRGRTFEFGKPALKHRKIVSKVIKLMAEPKANYDGIIQCAKNRGMSLEQFLQLDEREYTPEELRIMVGESGIEKNAEFANLMNDILTEVLYATVKKAPFVFEDISDFEEKMDDYAEAVELFQVGVRWIAKAASELSQVDRKNL